MAKKEEAPVAEMVAEDTSVEVSLQVSGKLINSQEQLAKLLKNAEVGEKLTGVILKMEAGQEERCFLVGLTKIQKQGSENLPTDQQTADAVRLMMMDGEIKVCADKVVVSSLSGKFVEGSPVPVQLVMKGWIKSSKGRYRDFDVNVLNLQS